MPLARRNALCSVAVPSAHAELGPGVRIVDDPTVAMHQASPLGSAVLPGTRDWSSYRPARPVVLSIATVALAGALVAAGQWIHPLAISPGQAGPFAATRPGALPGVAVLVQLAAAAFIGLLVTAVQREIQRDRTLSRSM